MSNRIFRLRVSLLGTDVWRLIDVPETYSFWDLHVAIQDAMGWQDYHLHVFRVADLQANPDVMGIGIPEDDDDDMYIAGWTIPVTRYFKNPGDAVEYEYDFGDGWLHEVRLMSIENKEAGVKYPRCVDGKRACPPEDCGGVGGYHELLEVLADEDHPDYEEMVDAHGAYQPDVFDPAAVQFWDPQERFRMMQEV